MTTKSLSWILLMLAMTAGCNGVDDVVVRTPKRQQAVFVAVKPDGRGRTAWFVERSATDTFITGRIKFEGTLPETDLRFQRFAAVPWLGRDFDVGFGIPSPRPKDPWRSEYNIRSGAWRGLGMEITVGQLYPATVWGPMPGQPPSTRPIVVDALYCRQPSLDACMRWSQAVERGLVWCQTRRGKRLRGSECRWYVPNMQWRVTGVSRRVR